MIIGIGSDLIDIRRIEKSLERHGERFISRIFTDIERARSERRKERAASYAKRFAAKEACSKALGTGLSDGVYWRDMGVVNLPNGKPTMHLTGGAAVRLERLAASGSPRRDPPDNHRRFSAGPSFRDHRGGRGRITATLLRSPGDGNRPMPLPHTPQVAKRTRHTIEDDMSVVEKSQKKSGGLGETVSVIVQALLLALVIRTLLFQPFSIPSGSMRPTLLEGDYLFVTKWAYGYSRHSLPFSPPIFSGRIWGSEPRAR